MCVCVCIYKCSCVLECERMCVCVSVCVCESVCVCVAPERTCLAWAVYGFIRLDEGDGSRFRDELNQTL